MTTVYAYLNPQDVLRLLWATHKVEDNVNFLKMEMPRDMALDCQRQLISNIVSQKYVGEWGTGRAYHPRYRVWKEQYGRAGGMKFWILWGDLLKNIKVFKENYVGRHWGWKAGIQASAMDTGGKSWLGMGQRGRSKPIAWYARILEYGGVFGEGGTHPPRPVFGPTLRDFHKEEGPKYLSQAAIRILRQWD